MKFFRRKRSLFGWRSFKSGDAHTKKKVMKSRDDFVKVVVTVHPFR